MTWVRPAAGRITSPYGPRKLAGSVSNHHDGLDLGSKRGPVHAARDGVVRSIWQTSKGAWVLDIRHPDEGGRQVRTRYIHMYRDEIAVAVGKRVTAGQQVGRSGASGTSAAHLHFEVLVDGRPVDPAPFLAARGVYLDGAPVADSRPSPAPIPTTPTGVLPVPITEDDDMFSDTDRKLLEQVRAGVDHLKARGYAYKLDGGRAFFAGVGTSARIWLDGAAHAAMGSPRVIPLPPDDPFWARTVIYTPGELYRRQGDRTGACYVLASGGIRHVSAAEYAAMGRPGLVDLPGTHPLWARPVVGG
ncbi:M23 family metallopeptidase [Actinotalea sp. JY-7876]|uniref:M23 family metallopeptidase n=1 Tax=Actinotalea sp. JY-7876 TaxID=2758442 RepID=UPI0015F4DC44|nr:M23 family metallopeptidase [Actinotalea sp. JY-7876]